MVIKVKVSDVAAGFSVQNKEVLDLLAQCGAAKKSPSTVLEEGELNALFDRITKTGTAAEKGEEAPVRR